MNLNQVNQHLNIVAQVYTKCGMAVMDVHCLLLRWPLMCVKGWHLFLDLVGMCVQSYSEVAGIFVPKMCFAKVNLLVSGVK